MTEEIRYLIAGVPQVLIGTIHGWENGVNRFRTARFWAKI